MQNLPLETKQQQSSLSNPLSDYIILSPLGRGAASFVYRIQSRKSKRELVFFIFYWFQ